MSHPLAKLLLIQIDNLLSSLSDTDCISVLRTLFRIRSFDYPDSSTITMVNVPDRAGAIRAAELEVGQPLTRTQRSCVLLLDPVRSLDWSTQNDKEIKKEAKLSSNHDALLLQTRGEASSLCA
jgi:hypothetical protein